MYRLRTKICLRRSANVAVWIIPLALLALCPAIVRPTQIHLQYLDSRSFAITGGVVIVLVISYYGNVFLWWHDC